MKEIKITVNAGFTLLEVLIAITVTGLVITVFSNIIIQTTQSQRLLEERLTAAVIGRGKLAELICGGESGLSGDFAVPYQKFKWNASEESLTDGSVKITLTVEWRDGRDYSRQAGFTGYRYPEWTGHDFSGSLLVILLAVLSQFLYNGARMWGKNDRAYERRRELRLISQTFNTDLGQLVNSPFLAEPAFSGDEYGFTFWAETGAGLVKIKYS